MKTNVLNQIKHLLGMEVKLEQMKLSDGMTVIEADSFEPEMAVVIVTEDEQKIPLPVGEYELEDGRILIVAVEGVISEIKDNNSEVEIQEPATADTVVEQSKERMPKRIVESIVQEKHFNKQNKTKMEEDVTPEDVVSTVEDAEAIVTEEIITIVEELTPDTVSEGDAAEIVNDVLAVITETIETMPEEVALLALNKVKKYGRTKMSEEEAAIIEDAQAEVVSAVAEAVNAGTPQEVTTEISQEIAETIVEAVVEIVAEQPAELRKQLFRKNKVKASKIKNPAVKKRVDMAKAKIELLEVKPISYNPEKTNPSEFYKIASKKPRTTMDSILEKLNK